MNVICTCEICKKNFYRNKSEVNRNKKLNRKTYCSLSCAGKDHLENIPINKRYNVSHLIKYNKAKIDEFSPFRKHLRNIKIHTRRNIKYKLEITLQDLKEQWDKQNGKCPLTGWDLINSKTSNEKTTVVPNMASVDRIDSSKGYTKDNIRFVSFIAQVAKNIFRDEDVIKFCNDTNKYQQNLL